MAQDITLLGAQYNDVPAVQLPKTGGGTARFDDASITTAVASDVTQGKVFLAADGTITTGTNSGGGGGAVVVIDEQLPGGGTAKHITAVDISDTTAVASDVASGKYFYTANGVKTAGTASGSGASSWTLVASTSYQVSTTSTYNVMLNTGNTDIWTSDKLLYIRIRDTAGPRSGYFYGSDNFVPNYDALSDSATATTNILPYCYKYASGAYSIFSGSYGGRVTNVSSDGTITIPFRYSSTYSSTINGTYSIQVYLLDMPTGAPIFT